VTFSPILDDEFAGTRATKIGNPSAASNQASRLVKSTAVLAIPAVIHRRAATE
jgi:hypothetical protein